MGAFVAIGLPEKLARYLAGQRGMSTLDPDQIATAWFDQMDIAEIGCLLLGSKGDALDIIAALHLAGYRGLVTVIAPPMPDPHMVERELKSAAKAMTVRLVVC